MNTLTWVTLGFIGLLISYSNFIVGFQSGKIIGREPWYIYLSCLERPRIPVQGMTNDNFIFCHNLALDVEKDNK